MSVFRKPPGAFNPYEGWSLTLPAIPGFPRLPTLTLLQVKAMNQSSRGASVTIGSALWATDDLAWKVRVCPNGDGWFCLVTFGGKGKRTLEYDDRDIAAIAAADQVETIIRQGEPW